MGAGRDCQLGCRVVCQVSYSEMPGKELVLSVAVPMPVLIGSRHAGRSTVNVSDVMMLARRNEGLESILRAFVDHQREEDP